MDSLQSLFPPELCQARLEQIERFWQGQGRYRISVYPETHQYRQEFDLDFMFTEAPQHVAALGGSSGNALPELWADWGTISLPKYWGGEVHPPRDGGKIYIHPRAQTIDEALALVPAAVDDPTQDAARAVAFFQGMRQRFPGVDFWLHTPDMQGVLNTAGLIMNQEALFVAMVEEPEKVHRFLQRVTDFWIEVANYLRRGTGERVCGNLWPYIFFPQHLGAMLTEDLMPLLSRRTFERFGIPYLKQINDAFGGVMVHCCGVYAHQVPALQKAGLALRAIEYQYPYTSLEQLAPLAAETVIVPGIVLDKQDRFRSIGEYYRYLLEETGSEWRFWFACGDSPDQVDFARQYGLQG
jgi:hypothetical protein